MSHTFKVRAMLNDTQKTHIITVSTLTALLTELENLCDGVPRQALVVKRGFPPKEIVFDSSSDSLAEFKTNENLLVTVELNRLPPEL